MGLFQYDENWTGAPNSRLFEIATERDFENQIKNDAYRKIGSSRRNSTEIKNGYGTITTKPILHYFNQWIITFRVTLRLLKEPKLRIEKTETKHIRHGPIGAVQRALVRRLTPGP